MSKRSWLVLTMLACSGRTELLQSGTITGQVVLVGADDHAQIPVVLNGLVVASTLTSPSGAFEFHGLPDGAYTVTVTAPSTRERVQVSAVVVENGAQTVAPTLHFSPVGRLKGRVTLGGATSGNAGTLAVTAGAAVALTDDTGAFALDDVPVGEATVQLLHSGYKSLTLGAQRVRYNQTTEVPAASLQADVAPSSPTAVVKGTVHLSGQATHGAVSVVLENASARFSGVSDAAGAWEIPGVVPGVYSLTFSRGEFQDTVPQVVALPGTAGFVLDEGQLFPLPVVEVARGRRLLTCTKYCEVYDVSRARRALLVQVSGERPLDTLNLVPFDGDGGAPLKLGEGNYYSASFSPDGTRAVYYVLQGRVRGMMVSTDGGAPIELAPSIVVDSIRFSPDGTKVMLRDASATSGDFSLVVMSAAGGPRTELAQKVANLDGRWTPDGTQILFNDEAFSWPSLWRVPVAGGAPVEIASRVRYGVSVSSEGRLLFISQQNEDSTAFVSHLSGTPAPAPLASHVDQLQFTPDGSQIVYTEYQQGTGVRLLKTVAGAGSTATQLATLDSFLPPIPTPDSKRVLYFENGQENLMSVPLTGGAPTRIETASSYGLEVSPDSRLVALYQEPGRPTSIESVLKVGRIAGGEPELLLRGARPPSRTGMWVDATHLIAVRQGVPRPLGFQNGVYRLTAE